MPIDSSIIGRLQSPKLEMQDPLELEQKRQGIKQLLMAGQVQEQAMADDKALRDAYRTSGGEYGKLKDLLTGQGNYKALQALEKQNQEADKIRIGIDKDKYEITAKAIAQHRDQLANVNTPEQAALWVQAGYADPYTGPIMSRFGDPQTMIGRIPSDPAGFQQWKQQTALGATKFIEANAPKINVVDTGGSQQILQTPGLGGSPVIAGTLRKTATPGEILTQSRENANDWQYDTERGGQVNKRTGEFRDVTRGGMPIGEKDKPLTDSQAKAALFGARMKEANAIFDELAKQGTTTSIPGSRAGMGVGAVINALSTESQQRLDQAKRDFINATLRRESGAVISPSEFNNAEQQYFPQIGDSKQVQEQKRKNRETAMRGVLAEVPTRKSGVIEEITGKPEEKKQTGFDSLPDPAQYKGRRIQGPSGIMRSDGTRWVMER